MEPGDWVMAIGNPFSLAHTVSVGVISATGASVPGCRAAQRQRAADRRGDQSREFGRPAAEPARRSDRREHRHLQQRVGAGRRAATSASASRFPSTRFATCCPACAPARSRADASACRCARSRADEVEALGLKDRRGAFVARCRREDRRPPQACEAGDVIVEFNGKPVNRSDDLPQIVAATPPGTTVPLKVMRDGKERTFSVRVEELDLEAETQPSGGCRRHGRRHRRGIRHHAEQRHARDGAAVRAALGDTRRGDHRRRSREPGGARAAARRCDSAGQPAGRYANTTEAGARCARCRPDARSGC